jgi:alginate O-acetyltransferase complex protein AlgI
MLFNTLRFLFFFLPVVLAVSLRLKGQNLLRWLTLSSFLFYASAGHAWFLIPMLVTTVLDFLIAPLIASARSSRAKRSLLMVSLFGNLGLLGYFKYSGLISRSGQELLRLLPFSRHASMGSLALSVALPAGISFYTFQTLSYVIDVYRGEAQPERNFWKFAGFVSFFPHLVAGPLTRHDQLIPALEEIAERGITPRWSEGLLLFAAGLAKKVLIADRIAALIDPRINDAASLTLATAWLALLGYSLQIYFDFSGYSDMAIGLGRLFAVELPINFDSPYQALNPSDFWRRWHITLSRWLRDYLYIPLGGSRVSPLRTDFNLMATMVLGGLWHGANWTFAFWGLYHGALLIAFRRNERIWSALPARLQQAATFGAVSLGWVFFRSESFGQAALWMRRLFDFGSLGGLGLSPGEPLLAAFVAAGLIVAHACPNAVRRDWRTLPTWGQAILGVSTVAAILCMNYSSSFLYFQF